MVSGVGLLALVSILFVVPIVDGWGVDGHLTVCRIAQARLSKAAANAVKKLLPTSANNDLGSACSWADQIRINQYSWSTPLHFVNTPDICSYKHSRDCKDTNGVQGSCVVGAINNYTTQLLSYNHNDASYNIASKYNLTEALLFLSHLMGDIHQPLHVGFRSDMGGNTIHLQWFQTNSVLHRVWDVNIIDTAEERFYNSSVEGLIETIEKNIKWANEVRKWEKCRRNKLTCPDIYATESIKAACNWAYKGVKEDAVLEDDYFLSRLRVVNQRLAQGGVRLAATLNRIFGPMHI